MLCTIDLRFAPPTCLVHHDAQGGPMSVRSGAGPRHFSFLVGHKEHILNDTGLRCAPLTYVRKVSLVDHGAQRGSVVHSIVLYS